MKLTYTAIITACRKAFEENRLQAQHHVRGFPDNLWMGCYYRAGGHYPNSQWGSEKPVIVCAIGAALDDETYKAAEELDIIGEAVSSIAWRDFFQTDNDWLRANTLQEAHDEWARNQLNTNKAEQFRELLYADS